jgi:soluble lytic murein transglycosylase-like protein
VRNGRTQPRIVFCSTCRGMKVGWNRRYIQHVLSCKQWLRSSFESGLLAILTATLLFAYSLPTESILSGGRPIHPVQKLHTQVSTLAGGSVVQSTDVFLKRHEVNEANRSRLAESIVASARRHNLNPKLIASIMIVESGGNPFAVSGKNSIGVMQIHLPTWGQTADREGLNLLNIEDNIELGSRILKNYIRQFGLWEGVKRYNGFLADDPTSQQSAQEYVTKVQRVYAVQ